jgi:hypothetical protein
LYYNDNYGTAGSGDARGVMGAYICTLFITITPLTTLGFKGQSPFLKDILL